MKVIALDTETTGLDLKHGAMPFFVSVCSSEGKQLWWEWNVNPINRVPKIPAKDVREIQEVIDDAVTIYIHNSKFDIPVLKSIGIRWSRGHWSKVRDTTVSSHLIKSNNPHNLEDNALIYLGMNVAPYERAIKEACDKARRICRSRHKKWMIARKGLECMPSAKEEVWKFDMWLPRAIAEREKYDKRHSWWTVLQKYGNQDTISCVLLGEKHSEFLGL